MWQILSYVFPGFSQARMGIFAAIGIAVVLAAGYAAWTIKDLEYDLLQSESDLKISQINEKTAKDALETTTNALNSAQQDIREFSAAQDRLRAEKEALSQSLIQATKRLQALDLTVRRNNEAQQKKLLDDINRRNGTFDLDKRLRILE